MKLEILEESGQNKVLLDGKDISDSVSNVSLEIGAYGTKAVINMVIKDVAVNTNVNDIRISKVVHSR